ncbi:MAG TPA: hypothetical protein VKM94_09865, partial [Blastocatellia bacterium]|nr:hypothetical protein [Blastocatellia bacterium]
IAARQLVRSEFIISVQQSDVFTSAMTNGGVLRGADAMAGRQRYAGDDLGISFPVAGQNLSRVVGGAIVDHDDFDRRAALSVTPQNALETSAQPLTIVTCGNRDRKAWLAIPYARNPPAPARFKPVMVRSFGRQGSDPISRKDPFEGIRS